MTYHSASCIVAGEDVTLEDGKAVSEALLSAFGYTDFRFQPDEKRSKYYMPDTQTEVYARHPVHDWVEVATFGTTQLDHDVSTERLVVGLEGKIPEDAPAFKNWKWEVSYNYGRVDSTQASTGDLILSHLQNALGPSKLDANGNPTCYTDNTFMTSIPGCVPRSCQRTISRAAG